MSKPALGLVGRDDARRRALTGAIEASGVSSVAPFASYDLERIRKDAAFVAVDAWIVDLDADSAAALDFVSRVSSGARSRPVIVCSAGCEPNLVVRSMRAGAREFLDVPIQSEQLLDALDRVSAREPVESGVAPAGKVFSFFGARGGVGVTTLASNFAIALRRVSGAPVGLVDLNLDLGDVAMSLGLEPRFTVADALANPSRLDSEFLKALMVEHSSGVSVLAGADALNAAPHQHQREAFERVLQTVAATFPYVVLDGGRPFGPSWTSAVSGVDRVFLVIEADILSLRNAQRFLTFTRTLNGFAPRVEIVLNRYHSKIAIDDARIEKALETEIRWRAPNDSMRVREAANQGEPLSEMNSPVQRALQEIAREVCGKPLAVQKAGVWSFLAAKRTV